MKLREAVLCIDCELLYSNANRCPACGSQVSYPLGRALNRPAPGGPLRGVVPVHGAQPRSRALVGMGGTQGTPLLQSA
ncbi:MAG TPA: hypothetical protein VGC00_10305 [Thermoanaerobaculia bacterium]|jgi:hypothetical protein